jgi:hypothetical protein
MQLVDIIRTGHVPAKQIVWTTSGFKFVIVLIICMLFVVYARPKGEGSTVLRVCEIARLQAHAGDRWQVPQWG